MKFSYKAHIWYEGTSHRYISPGNICKGQGQISGSCFSKDGCFGGISISQTHLFFSFLKDGVLLGSVMKYSTHNPGLRVRVWPVVWKEYCAECAEYWLKELQENMDRCTGHSNITVSKGVKHHAINQSLIKILCEKEKMLVTSIFSFSKQFFIFLPFQ